MVNLYKDENGQLQGRTDEKLVRWVTHFQKILNSEEEYNIQEGVIRKPNEDKLRK